MPTLAMLDGPEFKYRDRNLGASILEIAIADYKSMDAFDHDTAAAFLYPQNAAMQRHYDWVVSLAPGIEPAWLRSNLDQHRPIWERLRAEKLSRGGRSRRQIWASNRRRDYKNHKRIR